MVGPNLGGQAAGRNLARFSAALGEDEPLRGPVRELADVAVLGGAAQEWFFLRYSDPEPTCACGSAASPRT